MINNVYVGNIILSCFLVGFTLCLPTDTTEMHPAFDTTTIAIPFETTKTDTECVTDVECGGNSRCVKNYCVCVNGYIFDFNIHICVGSNANNGISFRTVFRTVLTWIGIAGAVAVGAGVAMSCCCCLCRMGYASF